MLIWVNRPFKGHITHCSHLSHKSLLCCVCLSPSSFFIRFLLCFISVWISLWHHFSPLSLSLSLSLFLSLSLSVFLFFFFFFPPPLGICLVLNTSSMHIWCPAVIGCVNEIMMMCKSYVLDIKLAGCDKNISVECLCPEQIKVDLPLILSLCL